MQQFQLNPGFAHQQGEGARAWSDVRAGVAAVIHGPRATECAGALFSGLTIVALEPDGAGSGSYPARVLGTARHLESLHRTLWEQGGGTQGGLGVGVAVLDGERVYFLQVGPSRLFHVTGSVCQEAAPADHAGSLLGAAIKSGIRVHTANVARHDRIVLVSGDLVATPGGDAIARMIAGDLRGAGPALLDLFGSNGQGAVAALEICVEADIQLAAPVLPISAEFEAPVPDPAPPAPAESGEWDFHNDVVQDLADFMSELQNEGSSAQTPGDPAAPSTPPEPAQAAPPQPMAPQPPVAPQPAPPPPTPPPAMPAQTAPPSMPAQPAPPPAMPSPPAMEPPTSTPRAPEPIATPEGPTGLDPASHPAPEAFTPPPPGPVPTADPTPSGAELVRPEMPAPASSGPSPSSPTPDEGQPRFSWSDENDSAPDAVGASAEDLTIVPPVRDPMLSPQVDGPEESGHSEGAATPPSESGAPTTVEMAMPDLLAPERPPSADDVPEDSLLEGPLPVAPPAAETVTPVEAPASPETDPMTESAPGAASGMTLENLSGGDGEAEDADGNMVSGVFRIKPQRAALDDPEADAPDESEASPMGQIEAIRDEATPGTPSLTQSFTEEHEAEPAFPEFGAPEPASDEALPVADAATDVPPVVVSEGDVPAPESTPEQHVLPDDDAEPVWDEEVMAGDGSAGRRYRGRTSYRLAILTLVAIAIPVIWFFGRPLLTSLTQKEQTQSTTRKDSRPGPTAAERDAIQAVGTAVERPQEVAMGEESAPDGEAAGDTPSFDGQTSGAKSGDEEPTSDDASTKTKDDAAKDTGNAAPAPKPEKVAAVAKTPPTTTPAPPPEPTLLAVAIAGPKGGTVTLDGKELRDPTPIKSLDLEPGPHTITVTYGRLGTWSGKVKVDRAGQKIDATPQGTLTFASSDQTPAGTVSIDGKAVGSPPLKKVTVPAGEHLVEFEGQGVSGFRQQVFVSGGGSTVVALPIVPEGEALVIAESRKFVGDGFDDAEGDSIFVDRKFAGLTPNDITVSPGVHSIRLASATGESISRIADMASGAVRVIRGDFGSAPRARVLPRPQPADLGPGDPFLLSARVLEDKVPEVEKVSCNVRTSRDAPFQTRVMRRVQSDDPYWVVLIRGAETGGGFLQYYFSATDADGAELVSEIYALTFDSVASNGVQVATGRN